jgi:hypothetical protein
MLTGLRISLGSLLLAGGLLAVPSAVAADPVLPPAFDELFTANVPFALSDSPTGTISNFQADCNEGGVSTFSFTVTGLATGAYPGSFSEDVTYSFDSSVNAGVPDDGEAFASGRLLSYEASFEVVSGDTIVNGSKQLVAGLASTTSAECLESPDVRSAAVRAFPVLALSYQAIIDTPNGDYSVAGSSGLEHVLDYTPSDPDAPGRTPHGFFGQEYVSDGTPPQLIGPGPATTLILSPPAATSEVGTDHSVTATVRDASGDPAAPTAVLFTIAGSTTTTGSCSTGVDGTCTFTYAGPRLPGADSIMACADVNSNGACDPAEPTGEATVAWLLPVGSADGKVTGGGQIPHTSDPNQKVAFGFQVQNVNGTLKGNCSVIDQSPVRNIQIKCVDVSTLVTTGTRATFFGSATVNGVTTTYRIDVDDIAEPGRDADTFRIETSSGYTASGVLSQGNIQVHSQ